MHSCVPPPLFSNAPMRPHGVYRILISCVCPECVSVGGFWVSICAHQSNAACPKIVNTIYYIYTSRVYKRVTDKTLHARETTMRHDDNDDDGIKGVEETLSVLITA